MWVETPFWLSLKKNRKEHVTTRVFLVGGDTKTRHTHVRNEKKRALPPRREAQAPPPSWQQPRGYNVGFDIKQIQGLVGPGWLAGWLVGWLVGWLGGRSVGSVCQVSCSVSSVVQ